MEQTTEQTETKGLPANGIYWLRKAGYTDIAKVEAPYLTGLQLHGRIDGFVEAGWEFIPASPSDTEQLSELRRIERELDEASIPKEVWIGTDSIADRVTWLITRNNLNQQNSRSRFKAMNELADLVEEMLTAGDPSDSWWSRAQEVLVIAGRRPVPKPA